MAPTQRSSPRRRGPAHGRSLVFLSLPFQSRQREGKDADPDGPLKRSDSPGRSGGGTHPSWGPQRRVWMGRGELCWTRDDAERERESFRRGPSPAEAWGPGRTRAGVLGALGASPRRKAPSRPRAHVLLTLLSVAILCVFPGDWTRGLVVPSSVTDRRLSPGESHRGWGFRIQPSPYSPFERVVRVQETPEPHPLPLLL